MSLRCSLHSDPVLEGALLHHSLDFAQPFKLVLQDGLVLVVITLQLNVRREELVNFKGRVSVGDGLQDGVVDERVLLVGLHHVIAFLPHLQHELAHIDHAFCAQLLQAVVDGEDSARAAHTSTAVSE